MYKEIEAYCKTYITNNYSNFFEFDVDKMEVCITNLHSKFDKKNFDDEVANALETLKNDSDIENKTISSIQAVWSIDNGFEIIFNDTFMQQNLLEDYVDFSCVEFDESDLNFEKVCDAIVIGKEAFIYSHINTAFNKIDRLIGETDEINVEKLKKQCVAILHNEINYALENCWLID